MKENYIDKKGCKPMDKKLNNKQVREIIDYSKVLNLRIKKVKSK